MARKETILFSRLTDADLATLVSARKSFKIGGVYKESMQNEIVRRLQTHFVRQGLSWGYPQPSELVSEMNSWSHHFAVLELLLYLFKLTWRLARFLCGFKSKPKQKYRLNFGRTMSDFRPDYILRPRSSTIQVTYKGRKIPHG